MKTAHQYDKVYYSDAIIHYFNEAIKLNNI